MLKKPLKQACSTVKSQAYKTIVRHELKKALNLIELNLRKSAIIWTLYMYAYQPAATNKTTTFLLVLKSVSPYHYCRKVQAVSFQG